jgi:uncharacterized protein (DUF2062 family)/2-polyprenyl-3-methyl-5-hydroxy-6-metoxy-1,4-benzoquinol methylase
VSQGDGSRQGPPRRLRGRLRQLWRRLRGGELSPARAAGSVATGLFVGSLPLFGLHFPLCVAVCVPLRLDCVVAYLAANISNPLFAPLLVALEVETGALILHGQHVPFTLERARELGVGGFVAEAAVGAVLVGGLLALIGAVVTWLVVSRRRARRPGALGSALERACARYAGAPRAARFYVAAKLGSDPALESLNRLDGSLGSVLDAGCGRGQLALALLELGRADSVTGFDWDADKIETARAAGAADARFERRDLREGGWPRAHTVLLLDVLHYLERADQDSVLEHAASAVEAGGRLVVREVEPGAGWRGRLTTLAEWAGRRLHVNRGAQLEFRPAGELIARLRALGFECDVAPASEGTPLANVMIVARRQDEAAHAAEPSSSSSAVA